MKRDKALESFPIYFTVLPSLAGFTDQLYQFSVFYKLGLSLGYEYLHSNFASEREGSENIYGFLGFNEHFSQIKLTSKDKLYRSMGTNNCISQNDPTWLGGVKSTVKRIKYLVINKLYFSKFNFIDIGLDDEVLQAEKFGPIHHFQNAISSIVSQNLDTSGTHKNVVRIYLAGGKYFWLELAPLVSERIPYFQDKLDLRSTYIECAKNREVKSKFVKDKIKLLMHIRLGDTALIRTPWETFVPLWAGIPISPLKEYTELSNDIFRQTMDVGDYWRFLQEFNKYFDADDLSTVIFSDGYKTAFRDLFNRVDELQFEENKIRILKVAALTYEEERFSIFDDVKNCSRMVGENNEELQELAHACFLADIIVIGCNQKMIPKLLGTYYDAKMERSTIIISLYKDRLPAYDIKLRQKATVYAVDVNNLESDEGLIGVIAEMKRRYMSLSTEF